MKIERHFAMSVLSGSMLFFVSGLLAAQGITSVQASPDGIAANLTTTVTITAQIASDPTLIRTSVNLVSYNAQGQALGVVGALYDDGTHGDQQAGDNMFTTQIQLNQAIPTQLLYKVSVAYTGKLTRTLSALFTIDVVQVPSSQEVQAILVTNQQAVSTFNTVSNSQGLAAARSATIASLSQASNVQGAGISPDGESIWVQYTNGLYGGMYAGPPGSYGGQPTNNKGVVASPVAYDPITNAPFAEPELESVYSEWLNSAGNVAPVPIVRGSSVSIDFMKTLSSYGVISLAAHGMIVRSGEQAIEVYGTGTITDNVDWARGFLYVNILYTEPWFVLPAFISHYDKNLPGSIVFLSVCHSLDNTNLSQAFIQNGAQTVFGWQNSVSVAFAKQTKDALMVQLLGNNATAGQAYQAVPHSDPYCSSTPGCTVPAVLTMDGDPTASLVPSSPVSSGWTLESALLPASITVYNSFPIVYDPISQRALLLNASSNGGVTGLTYLWNGSTWSASNSPVSPSVRRQPALAYDAARNQVVLFGGSTNGGSTGLAETWVWDGSGWTQKFPATSPPGRWGHTMAYNPGTQEIILYGGLGTGCTDYVTGWCGDTWAWNGTTWTEKLTSPQAASAGLFEPLAVATYDGARQQIVMFSGGFAGFNYCNPSPTTWVWNGSLWVRKNSTHVPAQRTGHGIAFNPNTSKVTLFGGHATCSSQNLNDTWTWDGTDWHQESLATNPPATTEEDATVLIYDSLIQQLIVTVPQTTSPYGPTLWGWRGY